MHLHAQGRRAALTVLGFDKNAASLTSTLIPKSVDSYGASLYKHLANGLSKSTLPPGMNTETPAMTYLTLMGKPTTPSLTSAVVHNTLKQQAKAAPRNVKGL